MQAATLRRSSADQSVPSHRRDIPSLDGLRALSILMVIAGHASWWLPQAVQQNRFFLLAVGGGVRGVQVFFVISGYLITTLLIREVQRTGAVSLRRFYFRRSLRIFPPAYVFLLGIVLMQALHWIAVDRSSLIAAFLYATSVFPHNFVLPETWIISHMWSLSVEEVFYLLWPVIFLRSYFHRWRLFAPLAVIAVVLPLRLAIYVGPAVLNGRDPHMAQFWIDTMMIGCLLALLEHDERWIALRERYLDGKAAALCTVMALLVLPWIGYVLPRKLAGFYMLMFFNPLCALCFAGILIYVVRTPESAAGRLLNLPAVKHLGVISYSLYLWQQIFMYQPFHLLPWGVLAAFALAEFSFHCVEQPALRARGWIQKRLGWRG